MTEIKGSRIKRFTGVLYLLIIVFIFSACDDSSRNLTYIFDNQSSYSVTITLSKEYSNKDSEGKLTKSGSNKFSLSGKSKKEIEIYSGSVDFSWEADSEYYAQYIYCVVDQNKAAFKNR